MALALPYPTFNPPWTITVGSGLTVEYGVHVALMLLGAVVVIATFVAQAKSPAPYGRHHSGHPEAAAWGVEVDQRTAHILSDLPPGVFFFFATFLGWGYGSARYGQTGAMNWLFCALWVAHYIHRGLIHPCIMRYSSRTTPIGIPLAGLVPNTLFVYLNATWVATCAYPAAWPSHPAFIIGLALFVLGFAINKIADWQLRNLRAPGETAYKAPRGGLFAYCVNPNYAGELVEWAGFALCAWSPPGLIWAAFGAATFLPRSAHNLAWARRRFGFPGDGSSSAAEGPSPPAGAPRRRATGPPVARSPAAGHGQGSLTRVRGPGELLGRPAEAQGSLPRWAMFPGIY